MTRDGYGDAQDPRDYLDGITIRKTTRDLPDRVIDVQDDDRLVLRTDDDETDQRLDAVGLLDLLARGEYYVPNALDAHQALRDLRDEVMADV